jgi:hypothetical protein
MIWALIAEKNIEYWRHFKKIFEMGVKTAKH